MKVLFACRFQKSPNDPIFEEIERELDTQQIIESDFDREKERLKLMTGPDTYDYAPIMFDLKDIATANYVDVMHTSVRMYNTHNYTIKIPFDKFIDVLQTLLGTTVNDFTEVDFNKPYDPIII